MKWEMNGKLACARLRKFHVADLASPWSAARQGMARHLGGFFCVKMTFSFEPGFLNSSLRVSAGF